MKANLFFGINLDFDVTINSILADMAVLKVWDKGLQKYLYIFPIKDMGKVISISGRSIDLEYHKEDILNMVQYAPSLKSTIGLEKYKGKGFLNIQKFPKVYSISTIINKKQRVFMLPIEVVETTWRAIKELPIGRYTKSKKIAEEWCKEMGYERYFRKTGTFDGDKLYGDRDVYFRYYYSLKVLEYEGVIEYTKQGYVSRRGDVWNVEGVKRE